FNGLNFTVVQSMPIGGTFATHWIASAPFLTEPYKGSDAYITKDGLMQAMVITCDGAALKMKKWSASEVPPRDRERAFAGDLLQSIHAVVDNYATHKHPKFASGSPSIHAGPSASRAD